MNFIENIDPDCSKVYSPLDEADYLKILINTSKAIGSKVIRRQQGRNVNLTDEIYRKLRIGLSNSLDDIREDDKLIGSKFKTMYLYIQEFNTCGWGGVKRGLNEFVINSMNEFDNEIMNLNDDDILQPNSSSNKLNLFESYLKVKKDLFFNTLKDEVGDLLHDFLINYNKEVFRLSDGTTSIKPGDLPVDAAAEEEDRSLSKMLFSWTAQDDTELSLEEGTEVAVVARYGEHTDDTEWWTVRTPDGAVGYVPANYVQAFSSGEIVSTPAAEVVPPVVDDKTSAGDSVKMLFSWTASGEGELSVEEGTEVAVVARYGAHTDDTEWWTVRTPDGAVGYVPARYASAEGSETAHADVSSSPVPADLPGPFEKYEYGKEYSELLEICKKFKGDNSETSVNMKFSKRLRFTNGVFIYLDSIDKIFNKYIPPGQNGTNEDPELTEADLSEILKIPKIIEMIINILNYIIKQIVINSLSRHIVYLAVKQDDDGNGTADRNKSSGFAGKEEENRYNN